MKLRIVLFTALAAAAGCSVGGVVEGEGGGVAVAAGPEDVAVAGESGRVAAAADADEAVADYRIDDGISARVRDEDRVGTFGGLGFGF